MSLHPHNIEQKTEVMVEHFRRSVKQRLGGRAKAMVVTSSRLHAVRYKLAFDRYIAKFGDRCTQELKLESRTLHEDASQVLMAIAAAAMHARQGTDVRHETGKAGAELKTILRKPMQRVLARWLLAWTRARVRDRENLRFERTRRRFTTSCRLRRETTSMSVT